MLELYKQIEEFSVSLDTEVVRKFLAENPENKEEWFKKEDIEAPFDFPINSYFENLLREKLSKTITQFRTEDIGK